MVYQIFRELRVQRRYTELRDHETLPEKVSRLECALRVPVYSARTRNGPSSPIPHPQRTTLFAVTPQHNDKVTKPSNTDISYRPLPPLLLHTSPAPQDYTLLHVIIPRQRNMTRRQSGKTPASP